MDNSGISNVPVTSEPEAKSTKKPLLLYGVILAVLIVGLGILGYVLIGGSGKNSEVASSDIDQSLSELDSSLGDTEGIEENMSDLPEDFLDSEVVTSDEVDEAVLALDDQIQELDGLDSDFELEATDVGL